MKTTLKITMGSSEMLVRADLRQAASPVEIKCTGGDWQDSQYQVADCTGSQTGTRRDGLAEIGGQMLAAEVGSPVASKFDLSILDDLGWEWDEVGE